MNKKRLISSLLILFLIIGSFLMSGCEKQKPLSEEQAKIMEYMPLVSSEYYKSLLTEEKEIKLYEDLLYAVAHAFEQEVAE